MTKQSIVFLFSGQGSQYRNMGKSLFENNPVFRTSLTRSEKIVQQQLGRSLIDELYFTTTKDFEDILITHPAIVAIQIAMYKVIDSLGIKADYVSGNSLGEFIAGVVAGIWDEETAIEATIEQAKSIVRSNISGGMLTIINQDKIKVEKTYQEFNLFLAADNFDGHTTISGSEENLDAYQLELNKYDIPFLRLPVTIPFHSPLILDGLNDFSYYMNMIPLNKPKSGFISGVKNEMLIDEIPSAYFSDAVSQYTNYSKTVSHIENKGTCLYIDLGPSGTSATFVKYNLDNASKSKTIQIMSPYGKELAQLEKLPTMIGSTQLF